MIRQFNCCNCAHEIDSGGACIILTCGNVGKLVPNIHVIWPPIRSTGGGTCAVLTRSDRHHRSKQAGNRLVLDSTRNEHQARAPVVAGPCRKRHRRMK